MRHECTTAGKTNENFSEFFLHLILLFYYLHYIEFIICFLVHFGRRFLPLFLHEVKKYTGVSLCFAFDCISLLFAYYLFIPLFCNLKRGAYTIIAGFIYIFICFFPSVSICRQWRIWAFFINRVGFLRLSGAPF